MSFRVANCCSGGFAGTAISNSHSLSAPAAPNCRTRGRQRSVRAYAVNDFFKNLFDFDNWAPRSTRVWRLQQFDKVTEDKSAGEAVERLEEQLSSTVKPVTPVEATPAAVPTGSFEDADDTEVAKFLNQRIQQIATTTGSYGGDIDELEARSPLTGTELRELVYTKYGKTYDLSFVRRDIPGKTFVCLNVMWTHLEQKSFKMTEEQYSEKLDSIAYLVNVLGQTDKVRGFLRQRARSEKGLPRRPVVGTAISIQLDLEPSIIEEWFGTGYH